MTLFSKSKFLTVLGIGAIAGTQAVELKEPSSSLNVKQEFAQPAPKLDSAPVSFQESSAAAEKWLKVLDAGNYPETWNEASATLKIKLPQESWVKIMEAMRKPLGSVKTRKIIEQIPKVDPQGLPKGEYMIVLYNSSFSHKEDVKELVILQQESNGEWKILTYQSS